MTREEEMEKKRQRMLYARQFAPRSPALGKRWKQGPKVTKERFEKALKGTLGDLTVVARRLGVKPETLYTKINNPEWAEMKALVQKHREGVLDLAEDQLEKLIKQEEDLTERGRNVRWLLERRRSQAYKEKTEVTVEGGAKPLQLHHGLIDVSQLNLPLELRRELLNCIEAAAAAAQLPPTTTTSSTPIRQRIVKRSNH